MVVENLLALVWRSIAVNIAVAAHFAFELVFPHRERTCHNIIVDETFTRK